MLRAKAMTIGQLARRTGVSIKTLREYERLGLIYTLGRSESNYRLFDESAFWCAWDALFIPPFLGQVVEVEAVCPATQQPIKLSVTPERVDSYEPLTAVISVVVPGTGMVAQAQSAQEVWMSFCNHVHFFSSAEVARAWFSGKPYEPVWLSLEDGYQLGQMRFAEMRRHLDQADARVMSAVINTGS
jgi:hypothetical protein